MSESIAGSEFSVEVIRPAVAPPGSVFSLGWLMAELFDSRRRVSVTARRPPFNPAVQLPGVPDLTPDQKLVFLAAELSELLAWYPGIARQAAGVRAQTDRVRAAIGAPAAAAVTGNDGQPAVQAQGEGGGTEPPGAGTRFSEAAFLAAVSDLHRAILDEFADDAERLSAYQLGLALSDLAWLACVSAPGEDPDPAASKPSALFAMFSRPQLAAVKTLLSGAGAELPSGTAAVVARSLDNWADWLDVNMASITVPGSDTWSSKGAAVLAALRVQGGVWRSVLVADPEVGVQPGSMAWVRAGASIARTAGMICSAVLRQFWPLVVIAIAALAGLLCLVIANLSGATQVWASLVTVAAVLGSGGLGLGSGVSRSFGGVGYEVWAAAKLDAVAWHVTWLPALAPTAMDRFRLDSRGVSAPQLRRNLDLS